MASSGFIPQLSSSRIRSNDEPESQSAASRTSSRPHRHRKPVLRVVPEHLNQIYQAPDTQQRKGNMAYGIGPANLTFLNAPGARQFPQLDHDLIDSTLAGVTTHIHLIVQDGGKRLTDQSNLEYANIALFGPIESLKHIFNAYGRSIKAWYGRVRGMKIRSQELQLLKTSDGGSNLGRCVSFISEALAELPDVDVNYIGTWQIMMDNLGKHLPQLREIMELLKSMVEEGNEVTEPGIIQQKYQEMIDPSPAPGSMPVVFDEDLWYFMQQRRTIAQPRPPTPQAPETPDWKHSLRRYGLANLSIGEVEIETFQRVWLVLDALEGQIQGLIATCKQYGDDARVVHLTWNKWITLERQYYPASPGDGNDLVMRS